MAKKESKFQKEVKDEIKARFPEAIITKLDSSLIQGIPDLIILWFGKWATLECKRLEDSPHQPNQDYYVERMNEMSFSRFIFPENRQEVLNDLERFFKEV